MAGKGKKPSGVVQALLVKHNDPAFRVLAQVLQKVQFGQIGLVAHTHHLGKAHVGAVGRFQNSDSQRPGLGDKADGARQRLGGTKTGVQEILGMGVEQSHAVGTHKANAILPCNADQLRFHLFAVFPHFPKASGYDYHVADSLFATLN